MINLLACESKVNYDWSISLCTFQISCSIILQLRVSGFKGKIQEAFQ